MTAKATPLIGAELPLAEAPLANGGRAGQVPAAAVDLDTGPHWVDAADFHAQLARWIEEHATTDASGIDPHQTAAWFALLADTATPTDTRFACWPLGEDRALALMRSAQARARAESLSTFYTPLYGALGQGDGGPGTAAAEQFARSLAARAGCGELRLWPMDPQAPPFDDLQRGLRRAGWLTDRWSCFGNWYHPVEPGGYAAYFAARPSRTRHTVERSARKLARMDGYRLDVHQTVGPELERAIADFVHVYERSWKKPEPFPRFIPGLCRLAAAKGWLRLGVMQVGAAPVAAQLWLVFQGKAHIVKLAYDQDFDKASAGSVLTAALMAHVIDVDGVAEIDYLIGDDAYKATWMTRRRERWGLVAFDPRSAYGLAQGARHFGGRLLRRLRGPVAAPVAEVAEAADAPAATAVRSTPPHASSPPEPPARRKPSIRGSLAYAAIEQYVMLGMQLLSYFIIARLLSPGQIGVFSVASALVGIGLSLRDFGTAAYIVQEPELSDERVRTAFGLTLAMALAMGAGVFVAAPWIAGFYGDPALVTVLRVLTINFAIIPFGSTAMALLRRELNFRAVLCVNIAASVTAFLLTIGLAFAGFGAMSLVWAAVANCVVTAGVATVLEPRHARLLPSFSQWRHVLGYGARNAGVNVVTQAAVSVNDLIAGRVLGFAPVALLSRAQGVMNLMHQGLLGAVRTVMFPALAKAQREGGDVAAAHRHALNIITVIAWPFYGFVALFPSALLRLMFGPQWDAAATLVPLYCLAGAFAALWTLSTSLLMASGRSDLFMRAEVTVQLSRLVMLAICAVVAPNVHAFAATFMLCFVAFTPLYRHYCQRALGTARLEDLAGLRRSAMVALVSLAGPGLVALLSHAGVLPPIAPWMVPPLAGLWLAGWLLGVLGVSHPIAHDPAFVRLVALLRPRRMLRRQAIDEGTA